MLIYFSWRKPFLCLKTSLYELLKIIFWTLCSIENKKSSFFWFFYWMTELKKTPLFIIITTYGWCYEMFNIFMDGVDERWFLLVDGVTRRCRKTEKKLPWAILPIRWAGWVWVIRLEDLDSSVDQLGKAITTYTSTKFGSIGTGSNIIAINKSRLLKKIGFRSEWYWVFIIKKQLYPLLIYFIFLLGCKQWC